MNGRAARSWFGVSDGPSARPAVRRSACPAGSSRCPGAGRRVAVAGDRVAVGVPAGVTGVLRPGTRCPPRLIGRRRPCSASQTAGLVVLGHGVGVDGKDSMNKLLNARRRHRRFFRASSLTRPGNQAWESMSRHRQPLPGTKGVADVMSSRLSLAFFWSEPPGTSLLVRRRPGWSEEVHGISSPPVGSPLSEPSRKSRAADRFPTMRSRWLASIARSTAEGGPAGTGFAPERVIGASDDGVGTWIGITIAWADALVLSQEPRPRPPAPMVQPKG